MRLQRRTLLGLAAGAAALPFVGGGAWGQSYPSRPVRLLVGFGAGGPADIMARLMAQWLSEQFGQRFVVENRAGAGSNIAAEAAVRSTPDGYTLLLVTSSNAFNATLYDNFTFDLERDIVPIASISRTSSVLEVNRSFPAQTVPAFIAYAKANPGKINVATAGLGSISQLYAALFKVMTGIDFVQVPYSGVAPALIDLMRGEVHAIFDPIFSSIGHIRAGELRPLAVTTAVRSDALPEVPPLGDVVPGFEASGWTGLAAPRNTPTDIVEKLNRGVNAALANSEFRARLADLGGIAFAGSPADFKIHIAQEIEKWGKVIRTANIKPK